MMRFLVDENLPRSTARVLRAANYEAADVREVGLRGRTDQDVFARAQELGAVPLTGDSDFANILRFPLGSHAGLNVCRIPDDVSLAALNAELLKAIRELQGEDLSGALVIVETGRVRIRRPVARND
jgi:predicted nuclease of predicted toxin-antitoxin system